MRRIFFYHVALIVAACLAASGAAMAAAPEGLMVSTEHILDPQMNNAVAATIAIPDGWKLTQGQVSWNFSRISDPAHIFAEVQGSADEACFMMISNILFAFGPYASPEFGFTVKKPLSAEDYIKELLYNDKGISDVQVKKVTQPQGMVEMLTKMASDLERGNREEGIRRGIRNAAAVKVTFDCALAEYTCLKKGSRYEGSVLVGITYTQMPDSVIWHTTPMIGIYAREGKLEVHAKSIATIMGNSSINSAWVNVVGQVINTMQQQKISAQQREIMASDANLRRQLQETYKHISNTQREVFDKKQASMSNVSRGWTDAITGTDRWSGEGESYSAPTGYNYAWQGGDGKTFYTNDSTFNPNHSLDFSGNWTQMKKIPW